jgi:hypothetical protein
MLSIETFRSPRSTEPMYVRWMPALSARASWDKPRFDRRRRRLAATRARPSTGFSVVRANPRDRRLTVAEDRDLADEGSTAYE